MMCRIIHPEIKSINITEAIQTAQDVVRLKATELVQHLLSANSLYGVIAMLCIYVN